jgi:hypothetical protein
METKNNNAARTNEISKPTLWNYHGYFSLGDVDSAGTPIGDLVTGFFISHDNEELAKAAVMNRFSHLSGTFSLRSLEACRFNESCTARIAKRGGTKDCPVLA